MKILIAPDSFKGSLTAVQAAEHIARGVRRAVPASVIHYFPIADGGEGTADALIRATGGRWVPVRVMDPLMRGIDSGYGVLGKEGTTAVVELASASGLTLLSPGERNPFMTTTYGTGQLLRAALGAGYRQILIGIGGSATHDGGAGMLEALGVRFYNQAGAVVSPWGGNLGTIVHIDASELTALIAGAAFVAACDVDNPLCGPRGAAAVFALQKGATPEQVPLLEDQLCRFGALMERELGCQVLELPGAGAAGGVGGALRAFLNCRLVSGIELVLKYAGLENELAEADLVFTGEGQLDKQTLHGKAPLGVARAAGKYGVPVIGLSGSLGPGAEELLQAGFQQIHGLQGPEITQAMAFSRAGELLETLAENVMKAFLGQSALK